MKTQIASYAGAALALIGLWFFLLFVPFHKQQASLTAQAIEAQQQLDDFKKVLNEVPRFVEACENLRAQKELLNSKLYTKGDILKLFAELKQQAQEENVNITEISPSISELLDLNSIIPDSSQLQILNMTLKLEGGYLDFGRFVGRIEQSDYFRGVNECRVEGVKDGRGKIRLLLGFKALLGCSREKV